MCMVDLRVLDLFVFIVVCSSEKLVMGVKLRLWKCIWLMFELVLVLFVMMMLWIFICLVRVLYELICMMVCMLYLVNSLFV